MRDTQVLRERPVAASVRERSFLDRRQDFLVTPFRV